MFKQIFKLAALMLTLTMASMSHATTPAKAADAKLFTSPEAAGKALADAVQAADKNELLAVVGPGSSSWLFSGDNVADRAAWKKFLDAYNTKNSITQSSDGRAFLMVGSDNWPFPAPIVKKNDAWQFDAEAGHDEIINRRVGRNELDTIQTLLAIVDAQREYATNDPDKNGAHDYAQKFLSGAGKKDGLYWPTKAGEPQSPLGELIAAAAQKGYAPGTKAPATYQGYRFRILKSQGKDAAGGAYSYMIGNRMIGGFAAVAYPAKYGVSGVMTFIVNHDGVVYQKDLGPESESAAVKMTAFNPDSSWRKVQ